MKFNNILQLILYSVLIYFNISCTGFSRLDHIVGKYYLVEVDTDNDLSICYETNNGHYSGKIPPTIIAYGYNDTFLVAKTKDDIDHAGYYIINMKKDADDAYEDTFRVGPISEAEYQNSWKKKLNIEWKSAD